MNILLATLAASLAMGTGHAPKAMKATFAMARVAQAFADAEDDFEVRRSQLGLLGSAPFAGTENPAPKARPAKQACPEPAQQQAPAVSMP
jgi:hypothetical protein